MNSSIPRRIHSAIPTAHSSAGNKKTSLTAHREGSTERGLGNVNASYLLIDGEIVMPEISKGQLPDGESIEAPEPDHDAIKLRNRLNRAAGILQRKRQREH